MSEYLVDTNVVSELMKKQPDKHAMDWLCDNSNEVRLASITVKELYYGALRMKDGKRKIALLTRIENLLSFYGEDIYDFDARCASACARLHVLAVASGRTPVIEDLMIAAIAQTRNIPIVTRNIKDFDYLGVPCINPFEYESSMKNTIF